MKRKDELKELRALSSEDLEERARTAADEAMRLRFRKSSGQQEQTHRLGEARRTLARAQTVLAERSSETAETQS